MGLLEWPPRVAQTNNNRLRLVLSDEPLVVADLLLDEVVRRELRLLLELFSEIVVRVVVGAASFPLQYH